MKREMIVLVFFILLVSVNAEEVEISETFYLPEEGKEVYFFTGSNLVVSFDGDKLDYKYNNRLSSDGESKTLPFGEPIVTNNRLSFTGKELDGELYYFNARYYNPDLARFNSVDPVEENHAYNYVGNNPMNLIDPTGMDGEKPLLLHLEVHPAYDHNGFFDKQYIEPDVYENYKVLKKTIFIREDFFGTIREVAEEFGPIDLLVYGFHGAANGLHVSPRYKIKGFNAGTSMFEIAPDHVNQWLNSQMIMEEGINSMNKYFSEDATCVGMSCSNAAQSEWEGYLNVQDAMALVLGIPVQALKSSNWGPINMNPETGKADMTGVYATLKYSMMVDGKKKTFMKSVRGSTDKANEAIASISAQGGEDARLYGLDSGAHAEWGMPGDTLFNGVIQAMVSK